MFSKDDKVKVNLTPGTNEMLEKQMEAINKVDEFGIVVSENNGTMAMVQFPVYQIEFPIETQHLILCNSNP